MSHRRFPFRPFPDVGHLCEAVGVKELSNFHGESKRGKLGTQRNE